MQTAVASQSWTWALFRTSGGMCRHVDHLVQSVRTFTAEAEEHFRIAIGGAPFSVITSQASTCSVS